jgi:predicted AAA+ superfamily ATPase
MAKDNPHRNSNCYNFYDYFTEFFVDEIHRGEDWKENLKAIIDSFPDLKLVVSGSSSLDLYKGAAELQRRVRKIDMSGLSFREYLKYAKNIDVPAFTFDELIGNYRQISYDLSPKIDPRDFKAYLDHGFYPYFKGKESVYHTLLLGNIRKVILEDLPTFMNLQTSSLSKLEKMFYFIAKNQPSELNYRSLAEKINISKDLLESIIFYLDKIGVLSIAIRSNKLNDIFRKEFKVFLGNPNIYYAF